MAKILDRISSKKMSDAWIRSLCDVIYFLWSNHTTQRFETVSHQNDICIIKVTKEFINQFLCVCLFIVVSILANFSDNKLPGSGNSQIHIRKLSPYLPWWTIFVVFLTRGSRSIEMWSIQLDHFHWLYYLITYQQSHQNKLFLRVHWAQWPIGNSIDYNHKCYHHFRRLVPSHILDYCCNNLWTKQMNRF